jgi:hypothetical protein
MTDPTAPDAGATSGNPASAQAEREGRVRRAIEELNFALLTTGMTIEGVKQAPQSLIPAEPTLTQVSDFWRAATQLLLREFEVLAIAVHETLSAVKSMVARNDE